MWPEAQFSRDELITIIHELRAENAALQAEVSALAKENAQLREEVDKRGGPPPWAKRNTPPREKKESKKRSRGYSRCRADRPDETLEHAVDVCPDCGRVLSGGWEYSTREVPVFPRAPVKVVRHVSIARRCGVCGRIVVGRPDPGAHGLVGHHGYGDQGDL